MMRSCKLWLLATMAKTRGRNQYISCVGVLICITTRLDFTPQLQSQRSVSSGLKAFQPHHQKSTYFTCTTLQKTSRVNWVTCQKSSKFLFDLNQYNLLYCFISISFQYLCAQVQFSNFFITWNLDSLDLHFSKQIKLKEKGKWGWKKIKPMQVNLAILIIMHWSRRID